MEKIVLLNSREDKLILRRNDSGRFAFQQSPKKPPT